MKVCVTFALVLVVAALLSCEEVRRQSAGATPNPVKLDEHSVLIAGTAISQGDQEAVNKIFEKYDSSLYRIAVFENGSLQKQLGKMSEIQVGVVASEYARKAKASGLTNWAAQIGNPTHVTTVGGTTHVTTGGRPTHVTTPQFLTHVTKISQDSDALVKEVTPILEKYSK